MKFFPIIIALFILATKSFAMSYHFNTKDSIQKQVGPSEKTGIAFIFFKPENELEQVFQTDFPKTKIPDNFVLLDIGKQFFLKPEITPNNPNQLSDTDREKLVKWLNQNKAGQAVLSHWFNLQPDGTFNFDALPKQFFTQPNNFTAEWDKSPVNKTYLIVFEWKDLQTMENYYNQTQTLQKKRILNGYFATYRSYVFKFDFNKAVAEKFFSDFWISDEQDSLKQKKQNGFIACEFPFFLISVNENQIASTQHNPESALAPAVQKSKEQLLTELIDLVLNKSIDELGQGSLNSKEQNIIKQVDPIIAVNLKSETVKFDSRFAVFENRITADGKISPTRVGMVKSMKPVNDSSAQNGNNLQTIFYQIAGNKLDNGGMYLKAKKDLGLNLVTGNTFNAMEATTVRMEYYISKTMGDMILPGKTGKGLTSVKIYIEGGLRKKTYLMNGIYENLTFTRGSFGFGKDYYPLRFLHWGPFIGYGLEFARLENSENLISTNFAETGVRLGINLVHNIQLMGTANYYFLIHSVLMNENRDVIQPEFDYYGHFPKRVGFGYSLGLRLML